MWYGNLVCLCVFVRMHVFVVCLCFFFGSGAKVSIALITMEFELAMQNQMQYLWQEFGCSSFPSNLAECFLTIATIRTFRMARILCLHVKMGSE